MSEDIQATKAPEVEPAKATKVKGKKGKRVVQAGQVHIQATFSRQISSCCLVVRLQERHDDRYAEARQTPHPARLDGRDGTPEY